MPITADKPNMAKPKKAKLNSYPFWSPRFWHGMRVRDWFRLLARNRFRIHPLRITMALIISACSVVNSVLYRIQNLLWGRKIELTEIKKPPVFIIGHWRSGTTHMHELMSCDDRFAYPTTYECFAPYHFILTGWLAPRMLWFLLPSKRPMDNMATGFERPQEDEFALCAMGAPTPYQRIAFPNNPPPYAEFLDMDGVKEKDLLRWKAALVWFLKALTFHKKKQLILKSPPHTGRIEILAKMYPGVRFVHIVRDPYKLFASNRRLWKALDPAQGLQHPKHKDLEEYIFSSFERMYRGHEKQRESVDPNHICDVRYEDLVRDPMGEVKRVYEKLGLDDFEHVREKLQDYVDQQKDYRPNQYDLEPEVKQEIDRRWAGYIEKYKY